MVWQGEVAHQMALLPAAFLGGLAVRHHRRDVAWWLLAGAFAISWLADTAADLLPRADGWIPSLVYPVSQAALICGVLLPRSEALMLLGIFVFTGCVTVLWNGVDEPDVVLRSVAWLAVVGVSWARWELPFRLRIALLVYFGVGWLAWIVHANWLIVPTWWVYQSVRATGLALFCWASLDPRPTLRVVRSARGDA